MVVVPDATPVTCPDTSTLPLLVAVLLHVPPPVPSVSAVVRPTHTFVTPLMAVGVGLIVITLVADDEQPVAA